MKILAFDISSVSTGVAVIEDGYLLKKHCSLIQPDPKKPMGKRLSVFSWKLAEAIQKHKPDKIIIEDIFRGRNIKTFKVLAQFRGVAIQKIYELTGSDPISLMAVEARKIVGCKNTKEGAFEWVNKTYKLNFDFDKDNDRADAIILALAAEGTNEPIRNTRSKRNSKRKRNKKCVSTTGSKTSSRSKPKRPRRRK